MGLSHEHAGSKILAKIQIYILTRAELLFTLCPEIPCRSHDKSTTLNYPKLVKENCFKVQHQLPWSSFQDYSWIKTNQKRFHNIVWFCHRRVETLERGLFCLHTRPTSLISRFIQILSRYEDTLWNRLLFALTLLL